MENEFLKKQADVFKRYLPDTEDSNFNAFYYVGIVNNRNIKVQKSKVYNGYSYSAKGMRTNYRTEYYLTTTNKI